MRLCLSINEALKIAVYTGQQVKITLFSGRELFGVVQELWPTSCRLWINPRMTVAPGTEVEKAIIGIYAIRCIAFDCENFVENTSCPNVSSSCIQGIRDALTAACITRQVVEISLMNNCPNRTLECHVLSVSNTTCCLKPVNSCNTINECIANIECVIFG